MSLKSTANSSVYSSIYEYATVASESSETEEGVKKPSGCCWNHDSHLFSTGVIVFLLVVIAMLIMCVIRIDSRKTACITMFSASEVSITEKPVNGCRSDYIHWKNYCYKASSTPSTFDTANQTCISEGGHLVSVHSPDENEFLAMIMKQELFKKTWTKEEHIIVSKFWIGLVYVNGTWVWTDGSPVDYTSWAPKEPNALWMEWWTTYLTEKYENYANGTQWNNFSSGDNVHSFICKSKTF